MPAVFVLASALTFVLALAPNTARAASDTPRTGWFTLACADQDLRAIAIIEAHGDTAATPPGRLTEAGFRFLRARTLCLSGRESEGVALYRSTIDSLGGLTAPSAAPGVTAGNASGRVPQ